jgi:hypothetical protein
MSVVDRIPGALLTGIAIAGVVWASAIPMASHPTTDALLRLAWSARPERVEDCRQRTPEELAQLPQHMREPVVCEGTTAEYRLQVRVRGTVAADRIVHGGGLRHDRRLYVLEEVAVPPGDALIEVRFDRVGANSGSSAGSAAGRVETVPPHLALEQHITFSPRQVVLITYATDTRSLIEVARTGGP